MNILLISSNSSSKGGGERYLVYLAKSLKSLGNNVEVLLSTNNYMDPWVKDFKEINIKIRREKLKGLVERKLRFISAILDIYQIKKITDICNNIRPDLIIVNQQYDEDSLDYLKGSLNSKIKNVIGVIHMPMTASKKKRPFGHLRMYLLKFWYYRNPYKLILTSKGSKKEFNDFYNKADKIFVINNSIPLFKIRNYETYIANSINKKTINITFVGQFVPQKNLLFLIDVWKQLLKAGFKVNLTLIGDGPLNEAIKNSLLSIDSKYWSLKGWCKKIDDCLEKTDIYLMPSLFESCPLSLIEAASKGIHCVVTPFNGSFDVQKYADWVYISKTLKKEDYLSLLIKIIKKKLYLNKINPKSLKTFRTYFSLKRMGKEVMDISNYG